MELSPENIKKPLYWLELPLEIARGVGQEVLRFYNVTLDLPQPKGEAHEI